MVLWSTGLYGSFDALCVCQLNLVEILQFGYGFYRLGIYTFGIIHLFQWDDTMNLEYCSLHIPFTFDEIVSSPLKLEWLEFWNAVHLQDCFLSSPWFLDHPHPLFQDDFEFRPEKKGFSTLLLRRLTPASGCWLPNPSPSNLSDLTVIAFLSNREICFRRKFLERGIDDAVACFVQIELPPTGS
ncbi:hypothetical protein OIU78_013383 [Salix suchowensis]|nr:hypothetical protein OIU78_013383 [Salix suchowensis]